MDGRRLYDKVAKRMPLSASAPLEWAQLPLDMQGAWVDAAHSVTQEVEEDADSGCDCPQPPDPPSHRDLYRTWCAGQERKGMTPKEWADLDEVDRWLWEYVADNAFE